MILGKKLMFIKIIKLLIYELIYFILNNQFIRVFDFIF